MYAHMYATTNTRCNEVCEPITFILLYIHLHIYIRNVAYDDVVVNTAGISKKVRVSGKVLFRSFQRETWIFILI